MSNHFDTTSISGWPAACKCQNDNSTDGGKSVNGNGICQYFCSEPVSGIRSCGNGEMHMTGDFIDCRSCKGIPYGLQDYLDKEEKIYKHVSTYLYLSI